MRSTVPGAAAGRGLPALLACALLFAAACARPPVSDEMTVDFTRGQDQVVVTAETTFELQPRNAAARTRVETARAAVVAGTDPWAVRFGRVRPEQERVTTDRTRGMLERVTRSARIAAEDLQLLLADANVTVSVVRGDGWRELALYAGSSNRGSREQARRFDAELQLWSRSVAHYFRTIDHLYAYLDEQPLRARPVFAALLNEKEASGDPLLTDDETGLVEAVVEAMERIATRLDQQEELATSFSEEADLLFNPFPARVTVRLPGEVLSAEGFQRPEGNQVGIDRVDLFAIVADLEGRWIEPDPLAVLLRDERPSLDELAGRERRSTGMVNPVEIEQAIRERLDRPRTYVVRWRE